MQISFFFFFFGKKLFYVIEERPISETSQTLTYDRVSMQDSFSFVGNKQKFILNKQNFT